MNQRVLRNVHSCMGFTLYELMLGLAVFAVTATIAVPTVSGVVTQSRLTSDINSLVGSLHVARAEAVSQGQNVAICRSTTAGTGTPSCDTAAGSWASGWVVFVNLDNDFPVTIDAGETIIRVQRGLDTGYTLDSSAAHADAVRFNATGDVSVGGEFVLCRNGDTYYSRSITVDRTGNVVLSSRDAGGSLIRRDGTVVGSCTAL